MFIFTSYVDPIQKSSPHIDEQAFIGKQPTKKTEAVHHESQRILNPQAFPNSPPMTPLSRERMAALASPRTHFLAKIHDFIIYILSRLREMLNTLSIFALFNSRTEEIQQQMPTELINAEKVTDAQPIATSQIKETQLPTKTVQQIKQLYESQVAKDFTPIPSMPQREMPKIDAQPENRVMDESKQPLTAMQQEETPSQPPLLPTVTVQHAPIEVKTEQTPVVAVTSTDENKQPITPESPPAIPQVEAPKLIPNIKDKPDFLSLAVRNLMAYFHQHADFSQKGIFRESGSKPKVDELSISLLKSPTCQIENLQIVLDTNVMTVVLKDLFGKMELFGSPEQRNQIIEFSQNIKNTSQEEKIASLKQFVDQLSVPRKEDLKLLLKIFERVCQQSDVNLMTAHNLAIAFGPRLCPLPSTITDQTEALKVNAAILSVAEYLILLQKEIFS